MLRALIHLFITRIRSTFVFLHAFHSCTFGNLVIQQAICDKCANKVPAMENRISGVGIGAAGAQ